MSDVNDELVTPEGMKSARQALIDQDSWFIHTTTVDVIDSIRCTCSGFKPDLSLMKHPATDFRR
jgi:hypothetical protein